ncbi:cadherin-related tumor suppressor [Caerostris extrusa]|uniref:Cadherin-related tumor suppressor n=1 Tax=Caerostris extrusa TaxID=172846 RepID=A0AAV4XCA0_CAEEX|nr:cadherin-related tumor suppressor [Caerostris extrusa]
MTTPQPSFQWMLVCCLAGMEKGYKIMTLSASDPDANNNGMVTYELKVVTRPSSAWTDCRLANRPGSKVTIIGTLRNSDGPVFESSEYTGSVLRTSQWAPVC